MRTLVAIESLMPQVAASWFIEYDHKLALCVDCPTCKVDEGERCITLPGHKPRRRYKTANGSHMGRFYLANRLYPQMRAL